jgi:hypothetical protein
MSCCRKRTFYDVEKIRNSIEVRRSSANTPTAKADILPVKDNQVTIAEFAAQWLRRRRSSGRTEENHES